MNFDTYSPDELRKTLTKMKLEGLKIRKIEISSYLSDLDIKQRYSDDCPNIVSTSEIFAEVSKFVHIIFDNGKKLGVAFDAASHVFLTYTGREDRNKAQYYFIARPEFFNDLIGKKIQECKVYSTKNLDEASGYWDDGFDEKWPEFILRVEFTFTDKSRMGFENGDTFTDFYYQSR